MLDHLVDEVILRQFQKKEDFLHQKFVNSLILTSLKKKTNTQIKRHFEVFRKCGSNLKTSKFTPSFQNFFVPKKLLQTQKGL